MKMNVAQFRKNVLYPTGILYICSSLMLVSIFLVFSAVGSLLDLPYWLARQIMTCVLRITRAKSNRAFEQTNFYSSGSHTVWPQNAHRSVC